MEGWRGMAGKGGNSPFPQVKGGTGAPLTVILRPLLVEDGVCRQFEAPPLVAVLTPLAAEGGVGEVGWVAGGPWELGEPWEGVAGLGREEEVAGRVAGLGALSLTDSHSDAPLVLVPSEGVGAVAKVSRLQAGWTRYLRGRGPFCRESGGREAHRAATHVTPACPTRKKGNAQALERQAQQRRRTEDGGRRMEDGGKARPRNRESQAGQPGARPREDV